MERQSISGLLLFVILKLPLLIPFSIIQTSFSLFVHLKWLAIAITLQRVCLMRIIYTTASTVYFCLFVFVFFCLSFIFLCPFCLFFVFFWSFSLFLICPFLFFLFNIFLSWSLFQFFLGGVGFSIYFVCLFVSPPPFVFFCLSILYWT